MKQLPTSPKEAREAGSSRYFTGNPCSKGHVAERLTRNATCVECYSRGTEQQAKEARARHRFRKRFKAELSVKLDLVSRQDGRCAICKDKSSLVLDHCHQSGQIRQALCNGCNVALGMAKDDPETLRAMADYIEKHRKEVAKWQVR